MSVWKILWRHKCNNQFINVRSKSQPIPQKHSYDSSHALLRELEVIIISLDLRERAGNRIITKSLNQIISGKLPERSSQPKCKPCTIPHFTTLHYTPLQSTSPHHSTPLHYTILHYITLHYTTIHCTTLYYTAKHYTE